MNNPTNQPTNQLTTQLTTQPTITLEVALWLLVAVVALALRLAHLDAAPLNGPEAREALLAWRAATGVGRSFQSAGQAAGYSPLLFAANALLFTLFGAGDGLARLWPALFGSILALTPFLLQRRLGRVGALAAGLYLALSPTALLASRQLDGAVVAAVGGMVLLGGLACFFDTGASRWLTLSAGGLALALTASSLAYGLLLTLGLAWLVLSWMWPARETREREVDLPRSRWSLFIVHCSLSTSHCSLFIVHCSLFMLALSTGLGWNPAGVGAAGDLLPAWIARFGSVLGSGSNPVVSPFVLMAVYEPLALLLGLGGLVWAVRHGHRFGALLGLWAGLAALLLIMMPGWAPLDVLWVVLPLALLTGIAVQALVRGLQTRGVWLSEGLYVPLVLILWAHCYLVLARYAESGEPADLALASLAVALQVLLALVFALTMRPDSALRGIAVGTGVALLALTLSAGTYVRQATPRELLVRQPTAVEVRDLVQTLRDLSWSETGIATSLPFTLEAAPDSVLAWYLRDFSAARRVEGLAAGSEEGVGPVVVTSRRDPDLALLLGDSAPGVPGVEYAGQDFALSRSWDAREIACIWEWPPRCNTAVKWLFLRRTPSAPVADEWAVLWLRQGGD